MASRQGQSTAHTQPLMTEYTHTIVKMHTHKTRRINRCGEMETIAQNDSLLAVAVEEVKYIYDIYIM